MVVNVTLPGHPLFPGMVARYISQSEAGNVINNVGEGASPYQLAGTFRGYFANTIQNQWQDQSQSILDSLSNPSSSLLFNNLPAAGGFLIYPNKSNTNQLRAVYSK